MTLDSHSKHNVAPIHLEVPSVSRKDKILAETRQKTCGLLEACAIAGVLAFGNPAAATEKYGHLADASGGTMLVLQEKKGGVVPPKEIVPLFKRLGYDTNTLNAVAETVTHMEAAQAKLGSNVVLGAMASESHADKPKILKDTTNNPTESFSALFGETELTSANYEKVFVRLLPDKFQIAGYKKRVTGLGPDMSNAWFQTFNAVVRKMPVQNAYLLQQALITTSSIYSYNNPTLNIASISPSVVADQLHRLMLLVSDESFTVARLMYGDTIDTAVSRRLPTRNVLKKIFGDAWITLPESLYDIAESWAREMGIGTDKYTELAMKKRGIVQLEGKLVNLNEESAKLGQESAKLGQESAKLGQESAKLGQESAKLGQESAKLGQENMETKKRVELMTSINELFTRLDGKLQSFIKKPNDTELVQSIRSDMIILRNLKKEFEILPDTQKETQGYQESMKLIAKIEQLITMHKISI